MVDLGTSKKVSTPLPAIVGQADLKRVLLALAVEPELSGALLRGEKGTAKSTSVRALAELLPEQRVVADCPYGCPPDTSCADSSNQVVSNQCVECRERDNPSVETRPAPLVTLPLGATRDRVAGTLSVSDALDGKAEFDPGLLAHANRGILYVDEVNLLSDHLIDMLLDAAAMGTNRVERDGVSVSHPAEFTLVGTMNPEEGELRPQLRDRFDLCVDITGSESIDERVEILTRVVEDTADQSGQDLRTEFTSETAALCETVHQARERNPEIPAEFKRSIAELCRDTDVDGHRADFAIARAARAFAALDSRSKLVQSDVAEAAEYALAHRLQSLPFEEPTDPEDAIADQFDDRDDGESDSETDPSAGDDDSTERESPAEKSDSDSESGSDEIPGDEDHLSDTQTDSPPDKHDPDASDSDRDRPDISGDHNPQSEDGSEPSSGKAATENPGENAGENTDAGADEDDAEDAEPAAPLPPGATRPAVGDAVSPDSPPSADHGDTAGDERGRATAMPSSSGQGPIVRTEHTDESNSVDLAATIRTAAQRGRSQPTDDDLRRAVRVDDASTLTVFLTDASASMAPAMRTAKGVALELLRDAYTERDEVALISFGGEEAEILLPPTTSVSLAARQLKELPTADRTPLPDGLQTTATLIEQEAPSAATVVLVSDGRANVTTGSPTTATRQAAVQLAETDASVLVVDAGESRAGVLDIVCETTDARRIPLDTLSLESVEKD